MPAPSNYEWTSLAPLLSLSPFPSLAPPPLPLSSLYPVSSFPLQYRQLASFQKSIFLAGKSESQHYTQHCKLFAYDGQLHCSLRENADYGYPTTSGKPHWYSLTLRPHPEPPPSVTCAAVLRSVGVWGHLKHSMAPSWMNRFSPSCSLDMEGHTLLLPRGLCSRCHVETETET